MTVTFNRDEAISRAPERPPTIHTDDGIRWIAPHDGEKGGTWMGVNERGVIACLLNAYLPGESLLPDTSGRYRSRGELIPEILRQPDYATALDWVRHGIEPESYPSFQLLIFGKEGATEVLWHKEGALRVRPVDDEWFLCSSSGWDSADVIAWRDARFADWRTAGAPHVGPLPAFHVLQMPENKEWSPLMVREWSATRSITQVQLDFHAAHGVLRYWGSPTPSSNLPDVEHPFDLVTAGLPPAALNAEAR